MSDTLRRVAIAAPIVGNIWQIDVEVGEHVDEGQTLIILESMKMEIPITAPTSGIVTELGVTLTQIVQEGDIVAEISAVTAPPTAPIVA
ncbi:MAG: acetyl-CoA carboxylase biotin carboxyl carrier protein subunit [Marmoricola sp.]